MLAIQPSLQLAVRAGELLTRSKQGELSAAEQGALERYLLLEHLVRLAKAHAYQQLQQGVCKFDCASTTPISAAAR